MAKTPRLLYPLSPATAGQISWITTGSSVPSGWAALSTSATTTLAGAATTYPSLWAKYTSSTTTDPIYRANSSDLVVQQMYAIQKRTKEITLALTTDITCPQAGFTITAARAIFFADSAGKWWVSLFVDAPFTSATVSIITITFPRMSFLATGNVAIAGSWAGQALAAKVTTGASGTIAMESASTAGVTGARLSGTLALGSEPTAYTIAANLEAPSLTPIIKLSDDVGGSVSTTSSSSSSTGTGGLAVAAVTSAAVNGTTLAINNNYVVDFSLAAASASTTLPVGATGSSLQVTAFGNKTNSYRMTVTAASGQKIYYDGSEWDAITISPSDYSVYFVWDSSAPSTRWVAIDWPTQDASIVQASDFNLCSNNNDALLGWGYAAGGSVTTDTSTVPLGPLVQTSIKITGSAANDYAHYRFRLPDALKQRKLAIEWWQIGTQFTNGDFKLDLYTNTAADYSGTATRVVLSTDSSSVSSIANMNGLYRTAWDADSSSYYEMRIVRTGAGAQSLYIAGVMIGYRATLQGAAVSDWISYTPTITPSAGTLTGISIDKALWRRVGTAIELQVIVAATQTGSTSFGWDFSLPTGVLITGDASTVGYTYRRTTAVSVTGGVVSAANVQPSTNLITVTPALGGGSFTAGSTYGVSFQITQQVTNWAGSGITNIVQNDVEYASNYSTATGANDTTSFAYGPAGNAIQNISTEIYRYVKFQTPIQATDEIMVEINPNGFGWLPYTAAGLNATINGSLTGGIYFRIVDSYTMYVNFNQYSDFYAATFGGAGRNWSGLASYKWRAKKSSGGQAVNFGQATPTSSGLVGTQQQSFNGLKIWNTPTLGKLVQWDNLVGSDHFSIDFKRTSTGTSAVTLASVNASGTDSGFCSMLHIRVKEVGNAGVYNISEGIALTNGTGASNTISLAMASLRSVTLGLGTLAWSAASGNANLTYTPNASAATSFIEVTVIQRKMDLVTV